MKNLIDVNKVFGFITMAFLLTSLALTTCICNGQRLMLEHQITESQIDYSLSFGKPVKLIPDAMECAISKTDDLDFPLCAQQNLLIRQQYHLTVDTGFYQRVEQMLKNVHR